MFISGFKKKSASISGFTLIEMLVVVAIIAVVMTMAIPSVYRQLNPDSLQKTVDDIVEACRLARADAILNQRPMQMVIRPYDRTVTITSAGSGGAASSGGGAPPSLKNPTSSREAWREHARLAGESPDAPGGSRSRAVSDSDRHSSRSFNATISERVAIEAIRLNVDDDFTEEESAPVRFYPNGTSDEFSIVLRSDEGEYRMINLEVVTGMPDVLVDPKTFLDYR